MKHKIAIVLLSLAACLCLVFGLAGCGDTPENPADDTGEETHSYTVDNVCSNCGKKWEFTEGLEYELDTATDTYTVTGVNMICGNIVIPYGYEGKFVTKIGDRFALFGGLTSVAIPSSVTSIGERAFYGCRDLTNITIPDSVTSIGANAFSSCDKFTSVAIPNSVTSIGERAFYWCKGLTSITISNSVTSIGDFAFDSCYVLESITVAEGNTVYSSQNGILYNKAKTEMICVPPAIKGSIAIPDGVTEIPNNALRQSSYLESISVSAAHPTYSSQDGILYNKAMTEIVRAPQGIKGEITIPDTLPEIQYSSLDFYFPHLEGISVSATHPTYSSQDGILYNKAMTEMLFVPLGIKGEITIPDSVTKVSGLGNRDFEKITVGDGNAVYSSQDGILYNKAKTEMICVPPAIKGSIAIPDGVTEIPNNAFRQSSYLESISVSAAHPTYSSQDGILYNKAMTEIVRAPQGIKGEITIPDSVTEISDYVLHYCLYLEGISVSETHPTFSSQDGILYNKAKTGIVIVPPGIKGEITILNGVTEIGDSVFYGCTEITSITIPESVTSFSYGAFYGCTSLTNITIPNSVTEIGDSAFYGCTSLTNITIPNSVTEISDFAFRECNALEAITVAEGNAVYSSQDGILYNKAKTEMICVPPAIKGEVTIPEGITVLYGAAFQDRTGLTSVTIPNGVTLIDANVFFGCTGLTSITIPESVTVIYYSSFYGCTDLVSVTFQNPDGWYFKATDPSDHLEKRVNFPSETLQDTAVAAKYLKDNYKNYVWTRDSE